MSRRRNFRRERKRDIDAALESDVVKSAAGTPFNTFAKSLSICGAALLKGSAERIDCDVCFLVLCQQIVEVATTKSVGSSRKNNVLFRRGTRRAKNVLLRVFVGFVRLVN